MRFIHLSDLHFHRNKRDNKKANEVLKYIAKQYPEHRLIITGDIVDDGHQKQYENAFGALKPFKGRVFIAPGNHDFGAAGNFYSIERARRFDSALAIPLEQNGTFAEDNTPVVNIVKEDGVEVMLIALDTNLETEHAFDFACGEIGKGQLAALDTVLNSGCTSNMVKLLFFHHHPFMHNNPFMELKDARELICTIYRKVNAVLFGHKHVSRHWEQCDGIQHVLASDNSPGKAYAREIVVDKTGIAEVNDTLGLEEQKEGDGT